MKVYESTSVAYYPDCIKQHTCKEVNTLEELGKIIRQYQEGRRFFRIMPATDEPGAESKNGIIIDYGSWSNFLYVDGISCEEYVKGGKNED